MIGSSKLSSHLMPLPARSAVIKMLKKQAPDKLARKDSFKKPVLVTI